MPAKFYWQLPARGDGRFGLATLRLRGERPRTEGSPLQPGVSDPRGDRFNYFDYLHQVARAAELSTFDGLRIQHDPLGDESWIIAGYVARSTRTLTLLTEFEAAWGSAVYAAKNAVSVQRYTQGRMAWQLSTGASASERRKNADPIADEDVSARIEEFVTVARGVISTAPFSFKGRFFEVRDGGFEGTLANHAPPPVFLSGETAESHELSARAASVHVFPALGLPELERAVTELRSRELGYAQSRSAPLEYAVRIDLLVRETPEEARFDAERYAKQIGLRPAPPETRLWPSLTRSSAGANATFVGSYAQAAEWLAAYASLGVTHVLLGAVPHLEEAYRVGTYVLPAARRLIGNRQAA